MAISRRRLLFIPAAIGVGLAVRPLSGLFTETLESIWPSETIVVSNQSSIVLRDLAVTIGPGGANHALRLKNCRDVVVDGFQFFGGGIAVEDCENVSLRNGLVSRNVPGRDDWSDAEAGVRFLRSNNVELIGSVVAYADSLVRVEACEGVLLDGCFTYNPRGPFPRGQHFQTWEFKEKRSRDITIRNHYALTDFTATGPFAPRQEDAISIGTADNVLIENVVTEMRGTEQGSSTGSGLMFEGGSTAHVTGFTSIGQANVGFGVSSRSVVTVDHTLSVIPQSPVANVAGFAWEGANVTFGDNVRLYGVKPDGAPYGDWWTGDATVNGLDRITRGNSNSPEAAAELAAVVRPPIPNVGFILPAPA
ncbi:MAG: hypothetical protein O3A10_07110 [Chloroflexi bacterium]|nr:hypothetical protein [Chloroflexota bacterium]MDA1146070.1 hypothetical protein [Chloroflexota bacterium]